MIDKKIFKFKDIQLKPFERKISDFMIHIGKGDKTIYAPYIVNDLRKKWTQINDQTSIKLEKDDRYIEIFDEGVFCTVPVKHEIQFKPKNGLKNKFKRIIGEIKNTPYDKNEGYDSVIKVPLTFAETRHRRLQLEDIYIGVSDAFMGHITISMICGYDPVTDTLHIYEDGFYINYM